MKAQISDPADQSGIETERIIPRPDISVSQIVLLILAQEGRAAFREIIKHPMVRSLGAIRSENSFYTALARLKRRRLIGRTNDHEYELTPTGEYAALKAYVRKEFTEGEKDTSPLKLRSASKAPSSSKLSEGKTEGQSRKRDWDGKWRIALFDIPESKRPLRDYIRGVLKRQGFKEFQRSMWIYPHKLPGFMMKLFADAQIRKYARVITTYDIDYDEDLRRFFRLS